MSNNNHLNVIKNKANPDDEFYTTHATAYMIMDALTTYAKHHGCIDDYLFVMCADGDQSEFVKYAQEYKLNFINFFDFLNWDRHIVSNTPLHVVIVTNPPFSLLSKWTVPKGVDYVLVCPFTALGYKNLKDANLKSYLYQLPRDFKNGKKKMHCVLISTLPLPLVNKPLPHPQWSSVNLIDEHTLAVPITWAPWFQGGTLIDFNQRGFVINNKKTFARAVYKINLQLPSTNKNFCANIIKCYIITLLKHKGDLKMDQNQNQQMQQMQNQQPTQDQQGNKWMANVKKYSGIELKHLQGYQYQIVGLDQNKYTYFKVSTNDMPRKWTSTTKNGKKVSKFIFDNAVVTGLQSTFFIPTWLVYFDGTVNYILAVEKNNNFNLPILRELSTLALNNKGVSINVLGSIIYK